MAYISNQDLITRVGSDAALQLTTNSGDIIAGPVLDEVVGGAQGEADGYLARRYAVPVDLTAHADLAATLKSFVLDIAEYRLRALRPPVPEAARRKRDDAVKWFTLISEGKIVLPASVTPASTTSDDPASTSESSPSIGLGGEDGIRHW